MQVISEEFFKQDTKLKYEGKIYVVRSCVDRKWLFKDDLVGYVLNLTEIKEK